MSIRPLNIIDTIENKKPDDLFISCISFEERCINAVNHLKNVYCAKNSLLIRYTASNEGHFREKHQGIIQNVLQNHIENKDSIKPFYFNKYNPFNFWHFLNDWFGQFELIKNITIDITTFTKCYLLTLLKFLKIKYPTVTIRILYTMGIYPKDEQLTRGVKEISILPYYGKFELKRKNSILILLLGYEAERAYSIWEYIDPSITIAIISNPPTYFGAESTARKLNEAILEHPDTLIEEVSAIDPIKTKEKLLSIYNNPNYSDAAFFIAPLGTKMQVVGVYLFFEDDKTKQERNAQIIYAYPMRYNEKKYTLDYEKDKVWEFYLR